MKVLVIGHLTGKDIRPHLEAEGRRVAELRADGLVRDVFLGGRSGPILLLNDTDADDARKRLATLPFIEHGTSSRSYYIELDDNSPLLSERSTGGRAQLFRARSPHSPACLRRSPQWISVNTLISIVIRLPVRALANLSWRIRPQRTRSGTSRAVHKSST